MNAAAKTPVVDCHALFGPGSTWDDPAQAVNYDLTELLDRGAEAGIDRFCLMAARNTEYQEANRGVARACERHPEKLIGFAAHNPEREAGRIAAMLREETRSMGFRGVRSDGHPDRELMDAAAELRLPVMYYPRVAAGQTVSRWIHTLVSAYPNVNFILPHLGQYRSWAWWGHVETIDGAKRYPNLYLDTSGIGSLKYLELAVHDLPPAKLLFGTAGPELDPRVQMEAVRLMKLAPAARDQVLGGNLLRLIGNPRPR
jgi:predicted TIM-barrel fold metal-dependent hydrolase